MRGGRLGLTTGSRARAVSLPSSMATGGASDMTFTVGLVSTYRPTICGIASFAEALREGLASCGVTGPVVRVVAAADDSSSDGAVATVLRAGPNRSVDSAAVALTGCNAVIVQFEYGIFGGDDGSEAIELLRRLTAPCIVVLHTVLKAPSATQRRVLEDVAAHADVLIVLSETARHRLLSHYHLAGVSVLVVPHGAVLAERLVPRPATAPHATQPIILTWGLMGPGKGIERGIEALAALSTQSPTARYLVSGQTHPNIIRRDGEAYRHFLQDRAVACGVADRVIFDGRYRDANELAGVVGSARVVLLPYDFLDQVSSGVLVEAVAAGVPVIATAFSHAQELSERGAGVIVVPQDPVAIAEALGMVLTRPALESSMRRSNLELRPSLSWSAVAREYLSIAGALVTGQQTAAR
jgi:polysaccharide biosynthesis protein PslF